MGLTNLVDDVEARRHSRMSWNKATMWERPLAFAHLPNSMGQKVST